MLSTSSIDPSDTSGRSGVPRAWLSGTSDFIARTARGVVGCSPRMAVGERGLAVFIDGGVYAAMDCEGCTTVGRGGDTGDI